MLNLSNIDLKRIYDKSSEDLLATKSYIYQLVEEIDFRLSQMDKELLTQQTQMEGISNSPIGSDGNVPIKGVDYFTQQDKQEMIQEVLAQLPVYMDAYVVTPRSSEQTLATTGRVMADDVTVEEIPYFEVSNNEGGKTVNIGG